MPEGATFSQGRPYGESEWSLRPDEIGDLRLHVPAGAMGASDIHIDLVAADGTILASAITRLDIAPDPKQALILRASESGRIDDLIAHGQKMIDVGYFAGARAYFKRAAEAGSGQAALMVGATYDQAFIDKIGAQGIKADPKEAIAWYERAKQLGVDDSDAKLAELRDQLAKHAEPQPAPVGGAGRRRAGGRGNTSARTCPAGRDGLGRSGRSTCWQGRMGRDGGLRKPAGRAVIDGRDDQGGGEGNETSRRRPQRQLGAGHGSCHVGDGLGVFALCRGNA